MTSPVKSCLLDPDSTFLLHEYVDLLPPLCHQNGQCVTHSSSAAHFAAACNSGDAAVEETESGHRGYVKLPTPVQPQFCVESH